jgi:hypothetical protein
MLNFSSKFEKVDSQEIEGLKLNYLFYDMRDDKGNFFPESAVTILDKLQSIFPKSKDMSFMLENEENYQQYFLTKEMKEIYVKKDNDYQRRILDKRKEVIIKSEKEFVEKLGIHYAYSNSDGNSD